MTVAEEYILSEYQPIQTLKENENSVVELVRHTLNDTLFIKRIIKGYINKNYLSLIGRKHINLPQIFHVIFDGSDTIVIEEYIEANPISGAMGESEVVRIAISLCDALGFLHIQKPPIIHRDIKPDNVLICHDGTVKLIDLGSTHAFDKNKELDTKYIGTTGYAAPEQYGFQQTDSRTDIFSLGKLMQELLTGDISGKIHEDSPLTEIINRCIQIDPDKRFQSVWELKKALKKGQPDKKKLLFLSGSGVVAAILAVVILFTLLHNPKNVMGADAHGQGSGVSSDNVYSYITDSDGKTYAIDEDGNKIFVVDDTGSNIYAVDSGGNWVPPPQPGENSPVTGTNSNNIAASVISGQTSKENNSANSSSESKNASSAGSSSTPSTSGVTVPKTTATGTAITLSAEQKKDIQEMLDYVPYAYSFEFTTAKVGRIVYLSIVALSSDFATPTETQNRYKIKVEDHESRVFDFYGLRLTDHSFFDNFKSAYDGTYYYCNIYSGDGWTPPPVNTVITAAYDLGNGFLKIVANRTVNYDQTGHMFIIKPSSGYYKYTIYAQSVGRQDL